MEVQEVYDEYKYIFDNYEDGLFHQLWGFVYVADNLKICLKFGYFIGPFKKMHKTTLLWKVTNKVWLEVRSTLKFLSFVARLHLEI